MTLSLTGIAGPEGGTAEKPVGLVYIALATSEEVACEKFNFQGERKIIKDKAATAALNMLRKKLLVTGIKEAAKINKEQESRMNI